MLPSMVFCTVTKLTETNKTSLLGPKMWIGCVRFVSGPNRCIVSVPAIIGALNATEHGFLHSNKTDRNEPKHHYCQKKWIGCIRFVSGPNRCIVSVPAIIGALNATSHGFLHSNKTDRNEPKHHYWIQKSGLERSFRFLPETVPRYVNGPNRCIKCNTGMVFCTVTKLTG